MKNICSTIFAISILALMVACGGGDDSVRDQARQSLDVPATPTTPAATSGQQTTPVTSTAAASGVQHYTCPNNCAGSGGATQENCPVCGTQYVHNQAYHSQPAQTQTSTTITPPTTPNTPTTPEPAQNAAGVWHYTCPAGCAGGGGSAVACASCGATLAHNTAYHN